MAVGAQRPPIEALADSATQVASGSDLRPALAAIAAGAAEALGADARRRPGRRRRTASSSRARSHPRRRRSRPRSRGPAHERRNGSRTGSPPRPCCGSPSKRAPPSSPSRRSPATGWSVRSRWCGWSRSTRTTWRSRRSRRHRSASRCARSLQAPTPQPTSGGSRGSISRVRRSPPAGTRTEPRNRRFASRPLRPARAAGILWRLAVGRTAGSAREPRRRGGRAPARSRARRRGARRRRPAARWRSTTDRALPVGAVERRDGAARPARVRRPPTVLFPRRRAGRRRAAAARGIRRAGAHALRAGDHARVGRAGARADARPLRGRERGRLAPVARPHARDGGRADVGAAAGRRDRDLPARQRAAARCGRARRRRRSRRSRAARIGGVPRAAARARRRCRRTCRDATRRSRGLRAALRTRGGAVGRRGPAAGSGGVDRRCSSPTPASASSPRATSRCSRRSRRSSRSPCRTRACTSAPPTSATGSTTCSSSSARRRGA